MATSPTPAASLSDPATQTILAGLTEAVAGHMSEWYGPAARLRRDALTLTTYRNSFFVRYPVDGAPPSRPPVLLVKIARKPRLANLAEAIPLAQLREAAQAEYEVAAATWRAFEQAADPRCAAIPTLAYWPEWNAIVMGVVEGQALKKLLLRPAIAARAPGVWAVLHAKLAATGRWLSLFHTHVGRANQETFDLTAALTELDALLARLSENSRGQVDAGALGAQLRAALESRRGGVYPTAGLHGDFHFSNVLALNDGRVCALDPYFKDRGPVYADLASLWVDPETRLAQVLSGGQWAPADLLARGQQAVLENYFGTEPVDRAALHVYCALAVAYKWAGLEKDLNAGRGLRRVLIGAARPLIRRHFRRSLLRHLADARAA